MIRCLRFAFEGPVIQVGLKRFLAVAAPCLVPTLVLFRGMYRSSFACRLRDWFKFVLLNVYSDVALWGALRCAGPIEICSTCHLSFVLQHRHMKLGFCWVDVVHIWCKMWRIDAGSAALRLPWIFFSHRIWAVLLFWVELGLRNLWPIFWTIVAEGLSRLVKLIRVEIWVA